MIPLVTDDSALFALIARARAAPRIGVDVEGNGMHAYRPSLCTLQLAWPEAGATQAAVVDTLAVDPTPLATLLGVDGPLKVLHDLTFDARMLAERGIVLGNVHDTSVAARFLDEKNTGLSSLSESYLGISLSKALQHHDWSERPLEDAHLAYLAGDVVHLFEIADALAQRVAALGIEGEVTLETDYKLATSLAPSAAPADYTRAKGYRDLAPAAQAILRRLFEERARLAEAADVPAHKIAPTAVLVEFSRRRPERASEVRRLCRGRAAKHAAGWLEAVRRGLEDGAPPADEQPSTAVPSHEEIAARRKIERALSKWRNTEAKLRGVSLQVVLPGHCVGPLVTELLEPEPDDDRLLAIAGLGRLRLDRYLSAWRGMLER